MSGLSFVGPGATGPSDVIHKLRAEGIYDSGIGRTYVSGRAHDLALSKATKVYTDSQDATYQAVGYSATANSLLVPNGARGTAGGVAALGSDGKVPTAQVPIMGAGMLRGPYGPANTVSGPVSTQETPIKLFDVFTGVTGVNGLILPFFNILAQTDVGRTVIEVRIGLTAQNAYADQTLLARGVGEAFFYDWQSIEIWPATPALGMGQSGPQQEWAAGTSYNIDCWMYDEGGGTSSTQNGYVVTAALFFARTSL